MLAKLKAAPSILDRVKWVPTLQDPHRKWKRWVICVTLAARGLRKLVHGSWRQHNQSEMKGAIKHRSDEHAELWQTGQADCQLDQQAEEGTADEIDHSRAPRWLQGGSGGSSLGVVEVRHTADNKFERWFNDLYGPSTWYVGHM